MNEAAENLTIAVLTTIAYAAVVVWYGGVIWQSLAPIIWSRILILLLGTLWALSLDLPPGTAMTSIDLRREGDV